MRRADNVATCRSCGAEIVWCATRAGNRMPVDAEPSSAGDFVIVQDDESGKLLTHKAPRDYSGPKHTSHFATCPHADEHRGRG